MTKTNSNSFLIRFLCLLFCFLFVFFCISRPVVVDAAAVTTIVIGGITYALTTGEVAAIIAILIAGGAAISGELVKVAEDIWDGLTQISKAFFVDGSSARKLVLRPDVRDDVYKNANKNNNEDYKIPISGAELFMPDASAWQNAETITAEQILYTGFDLGGSLDSIDDSIIAGNEISFQILNKLMDLSSVMRNAVVTLTGAINNISYHVDQVRQYTMKMADYVATNVDKLRMELMDQANYIANNVDQVRLTIMEQANYIATNVDKVRLAILSQGGFIGENVDKVRQAVLSSVSNVASLLDTFRQRTYSQLGSVTASLQSLEQKVDKIIEVLTVTQTVTKPQIDVAVGTQTITVTDYASMSKAFSAKMAWVPQIFDFLAELRSRLNSGTPPKIPIHLSAAEGNINWGDDSYILDMTWYARYKPSVDSIISGIMWLCFGWAIYKRIPDILSGVGLTVENATLPQGHVWSDRAERAERKSRSRRGG